MPPGGAVREAGTPSWPDYPGPVKEFVVYTGLRILLFLAALGVVLGIWVPLAGEANLLAAFVIALVVSGVGSYFLLNGPREALAQRVDARARAATSRFEEMRAKEDREEEGA